jgi:protein-L-isoaspartate(D-aspartate) O-methyltransferase
MWQLSVFILFAFASFPLDTTVTALFNTSSVSTILPSYHFLQSITSKVEQDRTNLSSTSSALNMSLRAWQCSGRTNLEMVENLKLAGIIKSEQVLQALLKVDRANYSDVYPYSDAPQGIGAGQTISAPHMHAHALEEILPSLIKFSTKNPMTELKILDVGCGSGYLVASFGRLVDRNGPIPPLAKGRVFGLEVIPRLVELSKDNILKQDKDLLDSQTVSIHKGDGWKGLEEYAPFHAIHVGAAAESFPKHLMMQLELGGCMVIPVGPDGGFQNLYRVTRIHQNDVYHENDFHIETLLGVRYVPLVHPRS